MLVVFDAFRLPLIEDHDGRIDASRFPNLAALAGAATWYRNATTAHENTIFSVPAILDGRAPRPKTTPTLADHPQNLFTLLGSDHRMNVHEEATQLCPVASCGEHASGNVIERLKHGRLKRFADTLRGIRGGGEPTLTFLHTFFPHEPRQYLPDGRSYQRGADFESALDGPPSFTNEWLTEQSLQRTLVQLMFTDRLVGRLVARLKASGEWDRSLVVLTADHGESFRRKSTPASPFKPGHLHWRRAVSTQNLPEIAPVPLFVKYPGEREGHVDDRFVKTVDILPTIAEVTEHPLTWPVAGRSLRDESYRGQAAVSVGRTFGGAVSMPAQRWLARRQVVQARVLRLFPAGAGVDALYGIGPRPDLHGQPLSGLRLHPVARVRATLAEPDAWRNVHLNRWLVPTFVLGRLSGGTQRSRPLAIAVNGRIAATAWSFAPLGAERISLSAQIPESALRTGRNDVRIYQIVGARSLRRLG